VQGRVQLKSLAQVLPLEKVFAYDMVDTLASSFADEMSTELGVDVMPTTDLQAALAETDVCVTCTSSRQPFLMREDVRPGTFVAAVGADNPLKQELDPALLASNKVVVDLLEQCANIGDLHHAIKAGVMRSSDVYAELGAIVAGRKPGRTSAEEIVIFDSTGTALQDVAAASIVYQKALSGAKGSWLNLAE
jgi:ornithine cyclodeaminase/alanine dehydrogenase-like protein (mu-crystallin family)